ncbi:MAG: ISL3 family transposase [Maribacter sp.]|nr:ISL3 family transposase [Maribacter sp.]
MNTTHLFQLALGLAPPWCVKDIRFSTTAEGDSQLDIYLCFKRGSKFLDESGHECPVHDTVEREWQHLSFFQHRCFLHARVPRIKTSSGDIKRVEVPWARPGSGFTLLFEAFAMSLIENEMPVNKAAATLSVYPNRLWTVFNYWITRALANDDQSTLENVGIDETSAKKGHNYVTLAADLKERRVIFVTRGKDEKTIEAFKEHLENKGVNPEQIKNIGIDMSPAFISGIMKNFPDSAIVFDRFHIVKLLNEAMDEVRKAERREHQALKGHKYTFLKKNKNLTEQQRIAKYELIEDYPILGEAYRLKELFDDFWDFKDPEEATAFLAYWCDLVEEANLVPFRKFANTIKAHWTGVLNYINAKISNGILEGINTKIQLAKRRARGFRNLDNFISMIYFIAGKLDFDYTLHST